MLVRIQPEEFTPGDFTFTSRSSRLLGVTHRKRGGNRYGLDGRFFTPPATGKPDRVRFGLVCIRARGLGLNVVVRRGAGAASRASARETARPGLRFIIRTQRVTPVVQGLVGIYPSRSVLAPVTFPALGPVSAPRGQNDDLIPRPTEFERAWAARDKVEVTREQQGAAAVLLEFLFGRDQFPITFFQLEPPPMDFESVEGTGGVRVADGVKAEPARGIEDPFGLDAGAKVNCTASWQRTGDPSLPLEQRTKELQASYRCDAPVEALRVVPGQSIFTQLVITPTGFMSSRCAVKANELLCSRGSVFADTPSSFVIATVAHASAGMGGQLHVLRAGADQFQGPFPITGP